MTTATATNRDEALAGMLDRLVETSRSGSEPDFTSVLKDVPDDVRSLWPGGGLERELRELWATAMVAEDLAVVSTTLEDLTGSSEEVAFVPIGGSLPRTYGDYELREVVGRGGMGVVYRGRQLSLNRPVAVKMILRGEFASPEDVMRFRSETEASARLSHPLIVPVYEAGELPEGSGQPFFSMQYIEGTTLAKRLADGPMQPRQAASMLAHCGRPLTGWRSGRSLGRCPHFLDSA